MTNAEAVYDVLIRLGQNSDDSTIGYRVCANWLDIARKEAIQKYFFSFGLDIPPSMIRRYECIAVTPKKDCYNCEYLVVELPVSVYNLQHDLGVYQVMRPGGEILNRLGSAGQGKLESKAMFGNILEGYYRVNNTLYLHGDFPKNIKLTIDLIPASINDLEEDSEFPAPSELEYEILEMAEEIGRRKLGTPIDLTDDGKHLTNA